MLQIIIRKVIHLTNEQLARRLRALEYRYFGSDYVSQRDAEDEEENKSASTSNNDEKKSKE